MHEDNEYLVSVKMEYGYRMKLRESIVMLKKLKEVSKELWWEYKRKECLSTTPMSREEKLELELLLHGLGRKSMFAEEAIKNLEELVER